MKHAESCVVVPVGISNIGCEKCGLVFSSISKLRKHNEKEHCREALACSKCGKFFTSEEEVKKHECHIVIQNEIFMITKGLEKILEADIETNKEEILENKDADVGVLKPKTKKKKSRRKSSHRRNTKNLDFYKDNLIIVNSDSQMHGETVNKLLECEAIEEDSDEEISSDSSSSSEMIETEDSETESGEIGSDIENPE